jgi:hypothetical protein
MISALPNGRDNSGQSGQARKHWRCGVPSVLRRLGQTRDRSFGSRACKTVAVSRLTLAFHPRDQCHGPQGRRA